MFQYGTLSRSALVIAVSVLSVLNPVASASPAGDKFKVVDSFSGGAQGMHPEGALTLGPDGALYGTLGWDPDVGTCGTIYRVRPHEGVVVLHYFRDGLDGCAPMGKLLFASDGHFYGTTVHGGQDGRGVVFRFDANSDYAVVASFTESSGIAWAKGELLEGQDGLLYGTSQEGGRIGRGTIFSVSKDGQIVVLYSFTSLTGENPNGELLQLSDGSLVGTASYGGRNGVGVVFMNDRRGGHTILHDFAGGKDGAFPLAGLTHGPDGKLYGTAVAEGKDNNGVLYRLDADGSNYQVFYRPKTAAGVQPRARLVLGPDGSLLGTMALGGRRDLSGDGVAFSITTSGDYKVLVRLDDGTSGGWPDMGLTDAKNGLFYGLTNLGGAYGLGTVFRFAYP